MNISKDGSANFTDDDVRALMSVGADILRINPKRVDEAWKKWASDFDVCFYIGGICNCLLIGSSLSQKAHMMRSNGRISGRRTYARDTKKKKRDGGG